MLFRAAIVVTALVAVSVTAAAQRAGAFSASRDHPAIAYSTAPVNNAASDLNARLASGRVTLTFDPVSGYLRSLLDALELPVESQVLVFSETSFQAKKINRQNPRAVYFNDRVAVGFVRGGDILEIAAHDPQQGTVFYQLEQKPGAAELTRNDKCLSCHLSWETLAVPGPMVLSTQPRRTDNDYANGGHVDGRTPIAERWGGWFVTGAKVPVEHFGNMPLLQPTMPASGPKPVAAHTSVEGEFDLRGFPSAFSDVAALMVLEHQVQAVNLITRAGWEYRVAGLAAGAPLTPPVQVAVSDLVDYLLFVDEAPLPSPIRGSSGFAEKFAAAGSRDAKGRSLRDLQLDTRLARYPLSYMVFSPSFEGLPSGVKQVVLGHILDVLTGKDSRRKFAHLTAADRQAVLEILRSTSPASVRHFL